MKGFFLTLRGSRNWCVLIFIFCNSTIAFSQNGKVYQSISIGINDENCNETVDAALLVDKEFSNTVFLLNTDSKRLSVVRHGKTADFNYTIEGNNIMKLKKEDEDEITLAEIIWLEKLPIIQFKDHSDDCFYFKILFEAK